MFRIALILFSMVPTAGFATEKSCVDRMVTIENAPPAAMKDGGFYARQYLCYSGFKCAVYLDRYPKSQDKERLRASLEESGLTRFGGRIRADLNGGAMNCVAYACKITGVPGFTSRMWFSESESLDNILNRFFDVVDDFEASILPRGTPSLKYKKGDLVAFLNPNGEIVHLGVLEEDGTASKHPSRLMTQSKFGSADIVDAPLAFVAHRYNTPFVVVYRTKL